MAVSSLSRMSVGLDQNPPNQGLLMPKLKYRFRVTFQNFGVGGDRTELTKQVVDFTRPSVEFAEIALPVYNSTVKLAGKYTWADVVCNIRDDASGAVSRLVGEQLQKQLDFMEMSSAASGIDYKFQTLFEVLDGGNGTNAPVALETWELYGCYLKSVNYNDMNYGTSEAVTITLNITFDNANQVIAPNGAANGVGFDIGAGRTVGDVAAGAGL